MKTLYQKPLGCIVRRLALVCIVGLVSPAQATKFSTFQLITLENSEDLSIRGDAYPGKIAFANRTSKSLCVDFKILDGQGNVLRYSKNRVHIPAQRTDLAVTGPGDNARSIRMALELGARAPCGPSSSIGYQLGNIVPGSVDSLISAPIRVDARSWSGNSRDVLIEINP